jgi:uncharacterized protein CbrC (UPF0167 family)
MLRSLRVPTKPKLTAARANGAPAQTFDERAAPRKKQESAGPTTFAQLGIPFPLFEAPSEQAFEYCGLETCSLCGKQGQHCFELGIGCALILGCANCGAGNGLDVSDCEDGRCRKCGNPVPFPDVDDDALTVCHACLRAGRAALTKDTELGMISWEQAFEGATHGVPGLNHRDFEMVPREDGWVGARLPQEWMFELLRTPTYISIQGEQWQFCCRRAMVFVGKWNREEFSAHAPDGDGRRLFEEVVQGCIPGLWEDRLHDVTGVYVFRCPSCARMRAHWDVA